MAPTSTSTSSSSTSGSGQGFMSEYMSDLSQSQDLSAFLQQNQPTYDPKSHSTPSPSVPVSDTPSSTSSSSASSGSSSGAKSTSHKKPFDTASAGSHPLPSAHAVFQKQAIQTASLDNCADFNMELTDCLLGKAGTWWDRASMCMKAKEKFGKCCRLNRELLQERGYAKEGNTAAQDRAILDYADKVVQETMKAEKS
ncbi:hypothetical protein BGZ93_010566 [Podila epicladia]|nr:hypothetical protein BGZ92_011443 [Podila epicladia]KAG0088108.1 hypothetical protein BGZ93_010566 [Podila epicladia]